MAEGSCSSGSVVEGSWRGERRYDEEAGGNERAISSTWNSLGDGADGMVSEESGWTPSMKCSPKFADFVFALLLWTVSPRRKR